ncbi:MAG: class I SAM-dependent methyltransferase [Rhodobacter sp.]|nr:class I SAM-dependent methyltransferase [Rhodobacter sp.]
MTEAGARWDERYAGPGYLFGTAPSVFLTRQARHLQPGSRVLAVADGEGRNSVWLAAQGAHVTAFDPSSRALDKARALVAARGVTVDFRMSDVESWNWAADPYDAVAAIFIQFAGPDLRDRVFAGLDTALRPGGLLLLHGFAPRQVGYGTGGPPHAENMYTLEMLHAAFPGYEVMHAADYDEVVDAGPGHNGLAALIDFVARKPATL